jgi:hypothetical protein
MHTLMYCLRVNEQSCEKKKEFHQARDAVGKMIVNAAQEACALRAASPYGDIRSTGRAALTHNRV